MYMYELLERARREKKEKRKKPEKTKEKTKEKEKGEKGKENDFSSQKTKVSAFTEELVR